MAYNKPQQIAEVTVENGIKKAHNPLATVLILGFLGERLLRSDFYWIFVSLPVLRRNGAPSQTLSGRRCSR